MAERLKILAFASWYPNDKDPQLGVFIKDQLEAIGTIHEVHLHTLQFSHDTRKTSIKQLNGYYHHQHFYTVKNGIFKKISWYLKWNKVLSAIPDGFDIIHVNVPFPIGLIALKAYKKLQIPLVVSEHWSGYISNKEYSGRLRKATTKKLIQCSSQVIVQSTYLKNLMEQRGLNGQYSVIPNIVKFSDQKREGNTLNPGFTRFLNIADHVDSDKNISGLLRGFSLALKINQNLHLFQIGGGPDTEKLKALASSLSIQDQVTWLGRLPNAEVLEKLHDCEFGIINSNQETFCISAFELIASKKPIIITDCGGPIEYLPEIYGIKIPVNAPKELSNAVQRFARGEFKGDMEKSASIVKQRFSSEAFVKRIDEAYKLAIK